MTDKRGHLFDRPRNVRRLLYGLYSTCALLLALEFLYHRHVQHAWDGWPGFYAGYGFVGCVLLVLVAKVLRRFLQRAGNYYDEDDAS
jgi:hypothetical protein